MSGSRYYVIMSDVHGNLPALEAVLSDIRRREPLLGSVIKGVFLLGDLIDYGMQSNEVVSYIRDEFEWNICCNLWGNHEHAIMCEEYDRFMSERGRQSARYTASVLSDETRKYIDGMNTEARETLCISADGSIIEGGHAGMGQDVFSNAEGNGRQLRVLALHGSLKDPYWGTIAPEDVQDIPGDAASGSRSGYEGKHYDDYDIVMSGHSHIPHVFTKMYACEDEKMRNKHAVTFINPGSVGQPRNHNPHAQYAILDVYGGQAMLCTVRYDIALSMSMYHGQVDDFYRKRLEIGV